VHITATHKVTLADYPIGYRVRAAQEAPNFFRKGRVFAMLWQESTDYMVTRSGSDNSSITVGKYSEQKYVQIRRFVVVEVNRAKNFVYAWSDHDQSLKGCS
jgi:hypothetical protein